MAVTIRNETRGQYPTTDPDTFRTLAERLAALDAPTPAAVPGDPFAELVADARTVVRTYAFSSTQRTSPNVCPVLVTVVRDQEGDREPSVYVVAADPAAADVFADAVSRSAIAYAVDLLGERADADPEDLQAAGETASTAVAVFAGDVSGFMYGCTEVTYVS